jgi:hypothetical protein
MLGSAFAALGSPVGTRNFVNVFFDEKYMSNYTLLAASRTHCKTIGSLYTIC